MNELIPMILNANDRYEGNLKYYYNLVMRSPNANAPYHNVRHMLHVFWEAYDGCVQMGLDRREMRNVLIAALMHDYDHTGIKTNDEVNIERSIRALDTIALECDRPFLWDIRNCIKATKYPYDEKEEFTPNQLILRDADQSQTLADVWIHSVLYGLGEELEMTSDQMLRLQRPFLSSLKFRTKWGQNKFQKLIEPRLKLVDQMISLLDEIENSVQTTII